MAGVRSRGVRGAVRALLCGLLAGKCASLSQPLMRPRWTAPARTQPAMRELTPFPRALAAALLSLALALGPAVAPPEAAFAIDQWVSSSDSGIGLLVNKDGNSILRLTLPRVSELPGLYTAQELTEKIKLRFDQVGFKREPVWVSASGDAGMLERVLQDLGPLLVAKAPSAVREQAVSLLARALDNARPLIGALRERNIGDTLRLQSAVATDLAQLQLALLPAQALPYEVPAVWAGLPQLRGRAEVEMKLRKGPGNKQQFCASSGSMYTGRFGLSYAPSDVKELDEDLKGNECAPQYTSADATIHLTLDGFHAPVTAGNFASLVNEGYFDRMPIQQLTAISIQTGNAKQAGRPVNKRTIPLEIFYKRDAAPTYSYTSDEDKRGAETLALPFQSYGALGMARQSADLGGEIDNDSATSEFFFVKYDQALIPPGRNTLDGAYSCFGYTSEGATYLRQLELGDTIVSAKLISGLENLISGK